MIPTTIPTGTLVAVQQNKCLVHQMNFMTQHVDVTYFNPYILLDCLPGDVWDLFNNLLHYLEDVYLLNNCIVTEILNDNGTTWLATILANSL